MALTYQNSGYIDLLIKKYLGVVESSTSVAFSQEAAGSARPKIISNAQIYSQFVPPIAPSGNDSLNTPRTTITNTVTSPSLPDLVLFGYVKTDGTIDKTNNGLNLGIVYTSITYPHIQFIQNLKLSAVTDGFCYRFANPAIATNILSNLIPFNFDPVKNSYTTYLYTSSGTYKGSSSVNQKDYIIDTDAGYLYFINNDWANGQPSISFYRYNGTIGIPTNLGNFAGAYAQDPTAIAIGNNAGVTGQGANALAIGNFAGAGGQGTGSIAIGLQAGFTGQGANSIAIGAFAGPTGLTANSIVLNASGTGLAGTGPTGGFYVAPVASYSGSTGPFMLLAYGADKQIVCVTGAALTAMNISSSAGGGGGGSSNPNPQLITLGQNAGTSGAVNIGFNAGQFTQGTGSIAIGYNAGPTGQGGVTGSSYKTSWVAASAAGTIFLIYSTISPNGQYQIMPNNNLSGGFYYTTNGNTANPTWLFKSGTVPANISRIVLISDNKNAVLMNTSYGFSSDFENINFSSTELGIGVIVAAKGSSDLSTILATSYTLSTANGYYLRLGSISNTPAFVNITPQLTFTSSSNLYINNNTTIGLSKDGDICITSLSTGTSNSSSLPGSSLYFTKMLKSSTATVSTYSTGYTYANVNSVTVITLTSADSNIKVGMYISYIVGGTTTGSVSAFVTAISNATITLSANIIPSSQTITSITFRTFALLDKVAPLPDYSAVNKSTNEWKVVALSGGSTNNKYYMLVGGINTFVYLGIYNIGAYLPTFTKTSLPQTNWKSYAISFTGQYMYALTTTGIVYYSDSYGESWTSYRGPSDTSYSNAGLLSLSDDGMFGLMTNSAFNPIYNFNTVYTNTTGNALALGTNAGQTNQGAGSVAIGNGAGQIETALSYGSFAKWFTPVNSTSINTVACSASGQIQLYGRSADIFYPYISKDSGQTFNAIATSDLPTAAQNIYAISADGNTIVIVTSSNATAYISPNTGASFPIRYTCGTGSETAHAVAVSGEGQYIMIITSLGVYFSNNFGRTFTNIYVGSSISNGALCAISYTGQYISTIINGIYYTSNDYAAILPNIYLPFESISGTNIDGINVTTNVDVVTNSSIKKIGTNSAAFGSNKYLVIPMDSSATSFTLCCWVYYNNLNPSTGAGVIFSLYNTGDIDTQSLADVFLSGSAIYSNINKFGTIPSGMITGPSIAAATWYHVALTFNYNGGSNGTYIVYVNGAIAGQRTTGALSTGYFFPNQLYMGRTSIVNNNQFIDGYVDDFRYYKSILNVSQISTIYGLASSSALPIYGLLTYLPFESILGTNIDGVVVNTNNGPIATSTSVKKIGSSSAAFNGSSNYIVTPVNYNIGTGFTICCWAYFTNLNRQFVWCLSAGYTNEYGAFIYLFLDTGNTINLVYNGSTIRSVTYTIPSLATGTWYHFSSSFNQNGTSTLYVNGTSVGTFTAADSSLVASWAGSAFVNNYPNSPNNQVLVIGTNSWSGDPGFFNGYIDDFRYYRSMLSAFQIATIYNITTTTTATTLAVSPSGQYQAYTNTNNMNLSTNFGESYSGLITPTNINSIVISQNGQMLAYNDGAAIYYSSNMGASWFTINPTALTAPVSLAMSADGSYFITASLTAVYTLNIDAAGNSVAIGNSAGQINQSVNAVAIGNAAGQINQPANTIVLNASGTALNPTVTNGCFIAPIATNANSTSTFFNLLMYGSDNQIVQSNNLKMDANGRFYINTGLIMTGSRPLYTQNIETQATTDLNINVPTTANLCNFKFNGTTVLSINSTGIRPTSDTLSLIYSSMPTLKFTDGINNMSIMSYVGGAEFKYAGTTRLGLDATGIYANNIRNITGVNLDINGNGAGIVNLQSYGNNVFQTNASGCRVTASSGSLVFSNTANIQTDSSGFNWYIGGASQVGYFDKNAWSAGYGWRINANQFMTMQCAYDMVIKCKVGGVPQSGTNNRYIQIVTPNSLTSHQDIGGGGWYAGACVFRSEENNGNSGTGIGISMSSSTGYGGNNWGYFTAVNPGNYWLNWSFGGAVGYWCVNNTVCAYINSTSGWQAASDERCKRDIQDLNTKKSLQRVLKCKPKHYKRILREPKGENPIPLKQEDIDRVHIGLLAQEVLEYNPHCVSTWEDDDDKGGKVERLGLAYQDFIIHLIGSVQEQQKQIQAQQAKNEEQSQAINTLTETMNSLTEHLATQQAKIQAQQVKIEEQSQAINTLTESVKSLTEHLATLTAAFNKIIKE